MKRGKVFAVLIVLLSSLAIAQAQQTVTLGNATVPLTGPWKFHIGDNMAWAQPGFDDSGWETINLKARPGMDDRLVDGSGYVPGWTAREYPGHHGYAWYQLRVNIENGIENRVQDGQSRLALRMPDNFEGAYQVYVNGELIGQFGRLTARGATVYFPQPRVFPLPADIRNGPLTLAVRMWTSGANPLRQTQSASIWGPPTLGQGSVIDATMLAYWNDITHLVASVFLEMGILLLVLLVALGLYALDRSEPAYLWLGLTCAALLSYEILVLLRSYTASVNAATLDLLQGAVLTPLFYVTWILFWGHWFRLDKMARLRRLIWGLALLLAAMLVVQRAVVYGHIVSIPAAWLSTLTLLILTPIAMLLVWVTVRGIRRNRTEGLLALPAVLLVAISLYQGELAVLHIPIRFFPFGFSIALGQIANMLSLAIIVVLLLRRFLRSQREREQLRQEIEQARQIQQVLIPEALPAVPGYTLESDYRPAQQVGGDFFQIIAHPTDGSVLIVLGDVTGHGLQAAMMVSLLVGTIRTETRHTNNPLAILAALNERLLGRGNANATCLALRLAPDGSVTLANAGHLPPYLNGKEMAMEGALPLGVIDGAEFSLMQFQLQPSDRLTLMTDGVMEAQNEKKDLFGFARAQQISGQPAATIAATAQTFGQEDDITVLAVQRLGSAEPATVPMPRLATA